MEKAPQLLVTGGVVRSIHRPVVLAEELLALSFGEVSQDHQRIGGAHPAHRTGQDSGVEAWVRAIRLNVQAPRLPPRAHCSLFVWWPSLISYANQNPGSQMGSQRRQIAGDVGRRLATISAASWHFKRRQATSRDGWVASYKRGVTSSYPVEPTSFFVYLFAGMRKA